MDYCVENEILNPKIKDDFSKNITAIDKDTVQKICSGQVIISLAIAVKELVENSLDAGSTIIEVKLKEYGLESIEVSDNGVGVEEKNFEGLTLRYNTSKIKEFSDLTKINTFGFRGEALNSLCALSDMVIVTRHTSVNVGTKLEFDHKGIIKKKTPCPRQVGTTVTLTNLFSTLPVRKKDYAKNIKKEFTKMCQILQSYCLVSKGVRIICTNQTLKGSKNTFLCTNGSKNIRDNIQAIFGTKQTADIIEIKPPLNEDEIFTTENLYDPQDSQNKTNIIITEEDVSKLNQIKFKYEGWISSCSHGSGRNCKDRQFFFINSRPCELKNIMKIVNEIYHRYNNNQYPFIFLNILLDKSDVDVNLTPDKRLLLINNEKLLLLVIKKALLHTFENISTSFKITNPILNSVINQDLNSSSDFNNSDDEVKLLPNTQKLRENFLKWKATGDTNGPLPRCSKRKQPDEITELNSKIKKIQKFLSQSPSGKFNKSDEPSCSYNSDLSDDNECENEIKPKLSQTSSTISNESILNIKQLEIQNQEFDELFSKSSQNIKNKNYDNEEKLFQSQSSDEIFTKRIDCKVKDIRKTEEKDNLVLESITQENTNDDSEKTFIKNDINDEYIRITTVLDSSSDEDSSNEKSLTNTNYDSEEVSQISFRANYSEEIHTTIDEIKNLLIEEENNLSLIEKANKEKRLKFRTEIDPNKNKKAEEELEREIHKDMFSKMNIIGQFNYGFIIVKLDDNLFIIDQHATDEKYNFETLQKTTSLQYQPLTIPQNLELTAVNEMILMDHLKIFEANGFKFKIDENAPITKKIKLIGKPFSKNWEFGKDDIDELIFMLQDAPKDTMCRPSRIRIMFASRACRKSVMIGTPLNERLMRKLIDHMGEIEHPWNCPHGRPTMRHLVNLGMFEEND